MRPSTAAHAALLSQVQKVAECHLMGEGVWISMGSSLQSNRFCKMGLEVGVCAGASSPVLIGKVGSGFCCDGPISRMRPSLVDSPKWVGEKSAAEANFLEMGPW